MFKFNLTIFSVLLGITLSHTVLGQNKREPQNFYIDSKLGSDENEGSKSKPWKSLIKVNATKFLPGDSIFFRRDRKYFYWLLLKDSGTKENPIVISAYGKGSAPQFSNNNILAAQESQHLGEYEHLYEERRWYKVDFKPNEGRTFTIEGAYVVIENLYFMHTLPAAPPRYEEDKLVAMEKSVIEKGALYLAPTAQHCIIRNNEFYNCPIAISVHSQHNLVSHNYIHDCNYFLQFPTWGPIAIIFANSNNEASHNKIENYIAVGGAFGADGGAFEIDPLNHSIKNIKIHHNQSTDNLGFLEITRRPNQSVEDIEIAYNYSEDYQEFVHFFDGKNARVINNTVLCLKPRNTIIHVVFSFAIENEVTIQNNIFVLANGLQVFDGQNFLNSMKWTQKHNHNLFYVLDDKNHDPIGDKPGTGDIIAAPLFVDFAKRDLRLQSGSPAVDAGINHNYSKDLKGVSVPQNGKVDIGAYESLK